MKKLLLILSLFSITVVNLSSSYAAPISVSQKKAPVVRTATLDGYLFTFYFDSASSKLDDVTVDGASVLSFYNDSISYNAASDSYEVVFFKVRYQVGTVTYARVFGSVAL
jgi:hypothetical protein